MASLRSLLRSEVILILSVLLRVGSAVTCLPDEDVCEIWLEVEQKLTMVTTSNGYPRPVIARDGKLYVVTSLPSDDLINLLTLPGEAATPEFLEEVRMSDVITADSFPRHKLVYVINGTLPGPPIECYENQTLIIHVKNKLLSEELVMHWHGMHQKGTPDMDGVLYVSQSPISPEHTFTYKFRAYPKGTHFYHAHSAMQSKMGVHAALIVRERLVQGETSLPSPLTAAFGPSTYQGTSTPIQRTFLQNYTAEYTMILSEWNHLWSSAEAFTRWTYTAMYMNGGTYHGTTADDGQSYGSFLDHSALINGRGRFRNRRDGTVIQAPVEQFDIKPNGTYLFRIINAISHAPFLLAFEAHNFELKATDGNDVQRGYMGDGLVIGPGERYDVILKGRPLQGQFTILAKTIQSPFVTYAEAKLKYSDNNSTSFEAKEDVMNCRDRTCVVFNCRPQMLSKELNCINLNDIKSADYEPKAPLNITREYFLNFAYPVSRFFEGGSINGRVFERPIKTMIKNLRRKLDFPCEQAHCTTRDVCHCTNVIKYDKDDVIQLVLVNIGMNSGAGHSVHLHGHSFHVMAIGYGNFSEDSQYLGHSQDLSCNSSFCSDVTWARNVTLTPSVIKDTVSVYRGGYTVVRFTANNPGLWLLHCHQDMHVADGMKMLLMEAIDHIPVAQTSVD